MDSNKKLMAQGKIVKYIAIITALHCCKFMAPRIHGIPTEDLISFIKKHIKDIENELKGAS